MSTIPDLKVKKLLCFWYGEPLYEEDAPREKLIEIIKYHARERQALIEQHQRDLESLKNF